MMRRLGWPVRAALLFAALVTLASSLRADPALPPKPAKYFNDGAGIIDSGTASELNEQLAQFERDTSCQIVVAIYPSLPDDADLADYCTRTANSWVIDRNKYGQLTGGSRGVVLFVFFNSHKLFIATGRDLEGALPDITCKQIIDNEITPAFKQGDYAGGLRAGVAAMMAATKGEYKGTGQTVAERQNPPDFRNDRVQNTPAFQGQNFVPIIFIAVIILIVILRNSSSGPRGGSPFIFTSGGFGSGIGGFGGGGFGGGSGFGGGGGSSGFGGFSGGGGGGFGGGGAGGSW